MIASYTFGDTDIAARRLALLAEVFGPGFAGAAGADGPGATRAGL